MNKISFDYAEDIVSKAIMFAVVAHSGQIRKGSKVPAIVHAMEAASIVSTLTEDMDVMAAALLHDTVEDTAVTGEQIEEMFGSHIKKLVLSETEDKMEDIPADQSWEIRKKASIEKLKKIDSYELKCMWMGDKLSNMRSFYRLYKKHGDSMWDQFHQKDISKQLWYYTEIEEALSIFKGTAAYEEYVDLKNKIFGKVTE